LIHRSTHWNYGDVDRLRASWAGRLRSSAVPEGGVVAIRADFSPDSIALLLACLSTGRVAALVPPATRDETSYLADSRAAAIWRQDDAGAWTHELLPAVADHELLGVLRGRGGAGLVLFSSGSTGRPKTVLHDVDRFLRKFEKPGKAMRTLAFLLFDHVAGLDTLFYTLSQGGSLVLPTSRSSEAIAILLEEHRVEVLPVSPTFLKFFCLSDAHRDRDLTSLKVITYGSEPMPEETLRRIDEVFPRARILQKYGTSEFGSPRSRSKERGSLWMQLDHDDMQTRIVDGILWIRSDTAMMGYLNAPSPFDEDGWYCTGDQVERDGEWIRILGRESDVINVGGEKVQPGDVEHVIEEIPFVREALVRGAAHPLTGQIVEALVRLHEPLDEREVRLAVRKHCRERLATHQVPVRVLVTDAPLTNDRQKKQRVAEPSS
jgi:acyl-CoA synthetase (AMP-forming)/AMP-acid ligase II